MFERFTESARRALFFARYEVTELGGLTIEPEHIVLGVLHDESSPVRRFLTHAHTVAWLRAAIIDGITRGEKLSTSVEVPFSEAAKRALERAAAEGDALLNHSIRPEHLVLGVMAEMVGVAAEALAAGGVEVRAIREYLRDAPDEAGDRSGGASYGPGMIVRTWKGVVKAELADEYVRHLKTETFPRLRHIDGHLSASILRRDVPDGVEFLVTTVWRSVESIAAFAGADVTAAVVPPAVQAMMVRYDERAVHYAIVL